MWAMDGDDIMIKREEYEKLQAENDALKCCNECMKFQLDHEPFDCKCSLDESCEWTRRK